MPYVNIWMEKSTIHICVLLTGIPLGILLVIAYLILLNHEIHV